MYEVRWEDGLEKKSSQHESEKGAKNKARDMSKLFHFAQVALMSDDNKPLRVWTFTGGKQETPEVAGTKAEADKKEAEAETPEAQESSAAEASNNDGPKEDETYIEYVQKKGSSKKKSSVQPTADEQLVGGEKELTTTEQQPKAGRKKTKASAKVAKSKTESTPIEEAETETGDDEKEIEMSPKAVKLVEAFNYRKDTNKGKIITHLARNYGKQVTINSLGRAAYGSKWGPKMKPALNMVLYGIKDRISKERIPANIVRDKNDKKEPTIGLQAK